jgi:hypothetical protein
MLQILSFITILASTLVLAGPVNAAPAPAPARLVVSAAETMPPDGDIILSGDTAVLMSEFEFGSTGVPMELNSFCLEVIGVDGLVTVGYYNYSLASQVTVSTVPVNRLACFQGRVTVRHIGQPLETMSVWVDATSSLAVPGDLVRVNWVDTGASATGLCVPYRVFGPQSITNLVLGPRKIWHDSQPTVSPLAASPDGAGIRGFREIQGFGISADVGGDIGLEGISTTLTTTDNAISGWNTCGQLGDSSKWDIVDAQGYSLGGTWTFFSVDAIDCATAGADQVVGFATVTDLSDTVLAGALTLTLTLTEYHIHLDTTGASAVGDDSVHPAVVSIRWYDGTTPNLYVGADGLPLPGGIIIF